MTTQRYTQCPHCNATFKVTEEQLGIANGRVRCGACMNIFDAIAYGLPTQTPEPVKAPEQKPSASDLLMEDEDLLFNDDPDEDKTDEGYSGSKRFSDELSDSFLALDEKDDSANFSEHKVEPEEEEAADESWASGMLDDELSARPDDRIRQQPEQPREEPAPKKAAAPKKQPIPPKAVEPSSDEHIEATIPASTHQEPPKKVVAKESGADWYSPELTQPQRFEKLTFSDAAPAPSRSKLTSAILGVACLLLVVLLLAQAGWFHYETLARYPQVAALYQKACQHFSCQLPTLSDIGKIRSNNLVVRSHPTLPKALIIETVLTNEAGFAQPFPDLGLYFSDINNNIIAQRRIKPSEYLSGELLRWEQFPVNQPIHISLEIMDPGKEAVNYNLKFFASEEPAPPITN